MVELVRPLSRMGLCLVLIAYLMPLSVVSGSDSAAAGVDDAVFQTLITSQVAPMARGLPQFAGVYLDRAAGGRAVVLLTGPNPSAEEAIRQLVGDAQPGVEIKYVAHSYSELQAGVSSLWGMAQNALDGIPPVAIALDTIGNSLDLFVEPSALSMAEAVQTDLSQAIGISISVSASGPITTQSSVCSDRDHCYNPTKAGDRVTNYYTACTMGFHVRQGSSPHYLTSGHCLHEGGGILWYHKGLGLLGAWYAQAYYENGFDSALMDMPAAQVSNKIYGDSHPVAGWLWPTVGALVYKSAGYEDGVYPSYVVSNYVYYWDGHCGCHLYGATMYETPGTGGDSGSPIYERHSNGYAYAVGTDNGTLGSYTLFARTGDALRNWGLTLVTS